MSVTVTAKMVKELREQTGAGVLDAKKALVAANGDFAVATKALREKGLKKVQKKASRQASEGLIEMYAHPGNRVGVIMELNCETDFVARNEKFQQLAHDLALQVAAMRPRYVSVNDVPAKELEQEREILRVQALKEGKPEKIVDRIIEGRINKFYQENCLLEQEFIKDDGQKIKDLVNGAISQLGENIVVRRFQRYELGESL